MNQGHFIYFLVPILIVVSWMIFIWWGRGKIIQRIFSNRFSDLIDEAVSPNTFNSGKIYATAKLNKKSISLYGQYTVIGTRYVWYLVLCDGNKAEGQMRPAFFGNGLALDYLQTTNPDIPTYEKSSFNWKSDIPEGWEFICAVPEGDFYFYRMPDFFGVKPLDALKKWLYANS